MNSQNVIVHRKKYYIVVITVSPVLICAIETGEDTLRSNFRTLNSVKSIQQILVLLKQL